MTKANIVDEVARITDIDKQTVLAVTEALMKVMRGSLAEGENIYLRGFGTFYIKQRAQKTGRNIAQNTPVVIPPRAVAAFKPSKRLSEKVKTLKVGNGAGNGSSAPGKA